MTALALLDALERRGVQLVPADGALRFRPVTAVTPRERELLAVNGREILALLGRRLTPAGQSVWAEHMPAPCAEAVEALWLARIADELQEPGGTGDFTCTL